MKTWITEGFESFRRGEFGNGGQNLYVSRKGVLQRIHQFDLNHNGHFDLVFANCQNHHESAESYVYGLDGQRLAALPGQGAVAGLAADLTGDGWTDLVVAGYYDMAAPFATTDIYFGSADGYSENRHIRIPTPFAEDVCCGRFAPGERPSLAFAMPNYHCVCVFRQEGHSFEWNRFTDLPIEAALLTAADLDGVSGSERVCVLGNGPVVSFMDRSTVYDKELYRLAFEIAKNNGIPIQTKTAVAGGNDAGAISVSGKGSRVMAISLPSRYIHSASSVVKKSDIENTRKLLKEILKEIYD